VELTFRDWYLLQVRQEDANFRGAVRHPGKTLCSHITVHVDDAEGSPPAMFAYRGENGLLQPVCAHHFRTALDNDVLVTGGAL
jgi:hypothetical protein